MTKSEKIYAVLLGASLGIYFWPLPLLVGGVALGIWVLGELFS